MGKLSDEETAQLQALQQKAEAPDDEDFEVEIGSGDSYARVPYSKGRSWLQKTFGIDLGDAPDGGNEETGTKEAKAKPKTGEKESADGDNVRRFGRRVA